MVWLPGCNSIRRGRRGWVESEIWFRILHVAADGHNGSSVASYREQTVEVALGPKGTFVSRNVGTVTRRVAADRLVVAAPARRAPKLAREPRTPRVVELLRKAIEWQALLESGKVASQAEIARREGITRARVTQVIAMLRLAPEIQENILAMPDGTGRPSVTERSLRPLTRSEDPDSQPAQSRSSSPAMPA